MAHENMGTLVIAKWRLFIVSPTPLVTVLSPIRYLKAYNPLQGSVVGQILREALGTIFYPLLLGDYSKEPPKVTMPFFLHRRLKRHLAPKTVLTRSYRGVSTFL